MNFIVKCLFFFLLFLSFSFAVHRHQYCSEPSIENLQSLLSSHYDTNVSITKSHFTCLAVRARGIYQSASVLINYNIAADPDNSIHFELECKMTVWTLTTISEINNASLFSLKTRYDCFQCITSDDTSSTKHKKKKRLHDNIVIDEAAHCRECNVACHGWGGGHCKSPSVGSCCPYFDANGTCTKECPNSWTGEKCTNCSLACSDGRVPDSDCSTCICKSGSTCTSQCGNENPCQNNGTCVEDINGNITCLCPENYMGPHCEIKNPCKPNPCQYGGICKIVNDTNFKCECPTGLSGPTCSYIPDECSSTDIPCYHGGECEDKDEGYFCNCSHTGYTGPKCELKDPCQPSPCLNGGICYVDENGDAQCKCKKGWTGHLCQDCADDKNSICTPAPTFISIDEGTTDTGLIMAIVFGIVGLLMIISLLTLLALLYRRYGCHRDTVKTSGVNNDAWSGVMVNPIYMTPELLASSSVSDVIVNKGALKVDDDDDD